MKEGFDVGLEMSGNPSAFATCCANMCHGGSIAMLGIPPEQKSPSTGTTSSSTCSPSKASTAARCIETWYKMTVMLQSGLNIRPIITHRVPYTDYQHAFDIMGRGQSGKVVMDWEKR